MIIDEAHHLRSEVLEDLRLLTNYAMDADNRLGLLFVGHPELRRRIGMAAHEALSQRIVVRHHLGGLARDELPGYLTHLLRRAGTELPLFEPAAQEAIFQATSGLPRKVNLLAHHAMLAAALAKAKAVSAEPMPRLPRRPIPPASPRRPRLVSLGRSRVASRADAGSVPVLSDTGT